MGNVCPNCGTTGHRFISQNSDGSQFDRCLVCKEEWVICSYCRTNLDVEKEVFSRDKLFKKHSCRGSYIESSFKENV